MLPALASVTHPLELMKFAALGGRPQLVPEELRMSSGVLME